MSNLISFIKNKNQIIPILFFILLLIFYWVKDPLYISYYCIFLFIVFVVNYKFKCINYLKEFFLSKNFNSIFLFYFYCYFLIYLIQISPCSTKIFEKKISFVIYPLLAFLFYRLSTKKVFIELMKILAFSPFLLIFYFIVSLIVDGSKEDFIKIFFHIPNYIDKIDNYSNIQRPFIGIIINCCTVVLIWMHTFTDSIKSKLYYSTLMIYFLFLCLIVSKISLLIFINVIFLYMFNKNGFKIKYFLIFIFLFILLGLSYLKYYNFYSDFSNAWSYIKHLDADKYPYGIAESINSRIVIWTKSLELVKQNWLTGVGLCYFEPLSNQLKGWYMIDQYNTHNEFLNHILSLGCIGVVLYIFFFGSLFLIGYIKKYFYLSVLVLVLLVSSFTENVLERQWSLFIFIFCYCFLYYASFERKIDIH